MRIFACSECDSTFTRKWSCGRHIYNQHGGIGAILDSNGMPVDPSASFTMNKKPSIDANPDAVYFKEVIREIARLDARNIHQKIGDNMIQGVAVRKLLFDAYKDASGGKGMFSEFFNQLFKTGA